MDDGRMQPKRPLDYRITACALVIGGICAGSGPLCSQHDHRLGKRKTWTKTLVAVMEPLSITLRRAVFGQVANDVPEMHPTLLRRLLQQEEGRAGKRWQEHHSNVMQTDVGGQK